MKRPFYRKPTTAKPTAEVETRSSLETLRERIINAMLYSAVIVAAVALVANLITDIPQGNWDVIAVYVAAFISLLVVSFFRRLPYLLRAYGLVFLTYLLGVTATLKDGIAGNGRVWMLLSAGLASILLGLPTGIGTLILATLTLLAVGGAFSLGWLPPPDATTLPRATLFTDWLGTGSVFFLATLSLGISLSILIEGLNRILKEEQAIAADLAFDRQQLDERSRELNRRIVQIRTAAEITRTLAGVLDPDLLLQQVVDLVRQRFDLYYVGAFLLDERGEYAVLRAGTGEAGLKMIASGHKLAVGGASMIGWTIANRKPRIALDVGRDAVRFSNPLLPLTRSEMALPLVSGDQVFGALSVQSVKPEAFDENDVTVLQGIADSLATALQNARLFQQTQRNLAEIQALNRQYVVQAWKEIAYRPELSGVSCENREYQGPSEGLQTIRLPLTLREQVIGQLSLEIGRQSLTPEELSLVEQVTTQAALAMENVRLLEETQRRASEERLVANLVQRVRSSADIETILRTTLGELGSALGVAEGMIALTLSHLTEQPADGDSQGNGHKGGERQ